MSVSDKKREAFFIPTLTENVVRTEDIVRGVEVGKRGTGRNAPVELYIAGLCESN